MAKMKFAVVGGTVEVVDISTTAGRAAYVAYRCRCWRRVISPIAKFLADCNK